MPTKLIEVALPLAYISEACVAEKKVRTGLIANLHTWWARRPVSASRAVLFAQLVDDPSAHPERYPTKADVEAERSRLFDLMKELVNPAGPTKLVLAEAQRLIRESVGDDLLVLDPFAGGGSIPIEAQRLGLNVGASDLNPVAVLLNRLVVDQLREGMGHPAVCPQDAVLVRPSWKGLQGLSEDVAFYGEWMRSSVAEALGASYPTVSDEAGRRFPVIAWLWARTVTCPNPACRIVAPLVRSFMLSNKKGREAWLNPVTMGPGHAVKFVVSEGNKPRVDRTVTRRGATCVACDSAIPLPYIRDQGKAGALGAQLMATVGLGDRRRLYFSPTDDQIKAAEVEAPDPFGTALPDQALGFRVQGYGMTTHASLFTGRQLQALTAFAELVPDVRHRVFKDSGGDGSYADLVATILGMCVSKLANRSNSLVPWSYSVECPLHLFTQQSVAMLWDFAEANPIGSSSGSFSAVVESTIRSLKGPLVEYERVGSVSVAQENATTRSYPSGVVISTDPPYFDNIGYADLSDFFYVWLRLALREIHPDLFGTLLTPKSDELIATPFRFNGSQEDANQHFEDGFRQVFSRIRSQHRADIPMTVFYAYKQEDDEETADGSVSGAGATGWEKLLQGMVDAQLQITATWPMRTERPGRMIGQGSNALASSVVLACRSRQQDAGITDRQGFIRHLRRVIGEKLIELQSGGVQPVDMAQASIGPGMAVFTSYSRVVDGADQSMTVGTALQIINRVLDELQTEQEAEFDADTRWAVTWFDQHGMDTGDFGDALNLATARGTAMNALERSGIVQARSGRVRLLDRSEYPDDWDPSTDKRVTVWEVCQHLIRRVQGDGGLMAAAALLRQVGGLGDAARDLSYRLYEIANRNGWAEEARAYNNLAAEWPDLVALAAQAPADPSTLF